MIEKAQTNSKRGRASLLPYDTSSAYCTLTSKTQKIKNTVKAKNDNCLDFENRVRYYKRKSGKKSV